MILTHKHGKAAYMADRVRAAIAAGRSVLVVTPAGSIDGRQWLANRGMSLLGVTVDHDPGDEDGIAR